jgi:putative copper export protein
VTALALCRFAHFMTAMLTFGTSAYLWLYAPERLTLALSPIVRRLTLIASLVALITAIVWLALESDSMADNWNAAVDPDQIGAVLTDTAFGHVWTAHLFLAATLVTVVAFGPRARWAGITTASGALLASLGLVGHAAMQTGAEGVLHRGNHAVHLLTTGAWIGGLVTFAMCLRAYRRDDLRKDAVRAMTDFSFWGQLNVAAIILTGVVNIALTSHHAPIPAATPYRALLLSKIIVVAIMISLALFNRFVLAPRLGAVRHREFAMASGEMRPDEFTRFLAGAFDNARACMSPGAIIYACMDWRHMAEMLAAGDSAKFELLNLCVWVKTNGGMGSLYRSRHELVFVFRNGGEAHCNNVQLGRFGRNRTNVWNYPGANVFKRNGRKTDLDLHPTVKPIAMVADAIMDSTNLDDVILDPFLGSGTTLLAAERARRRCHGVELDPLYVDTVITRWERLTQQQARLASGQSFNDVKSERSAK